MEYLAGPKARNLVMEFWNSGEPGWDITETLKTAKVALGAVHDVGLVGSVGVINKDQRLYLINKTKLEQ